MAVNHFYSVFPSSLVNQSFLINTTAGSYDLTFPDLDSWKNELCTFAVFQGVRLGCAAMTLLMLLLFQRKKTVLFFLYLFSLTCIIIHAGLILGYVFGAFSSSRANLTGSYYDITANDLAVNVTGSVFQVIIIICVEACLLLNANVILSDLGKKKLKNALLIVLCLVATIPCIFVWMFYSVVDIAGVINPGYFAESMPMWPANIASPYFTATIALFSAVSCLKLVVAIRRRRQLGLKQLDVYQIFFVMTFQTMIIPLVLTAISFAVDKVPAGFSGFSSLIVVVFLPLTGIWARFKVISPVIKNQYFLPMPETDSISLASSTTMPTTGNDTLNDRGLAADILEKYSFADAEQTGYYLNFQNESRTDDNI